MSDLMRAYTGFTTTESGGLSGGRRLQRPETTPAGEVHAARPGDAQALCGTPIVKVDGKQRWPGGGTLCRKCLKLARPGGSATD